MTQLVINVGSAPNDGLGDPIRTAYQKCNTNFSELYSRVQTTPPTTLVGTVGDTAGMYAYDSTYFYYCFADYDGSSVIWGRSYDAADLAVSNIINGNTSVVAYANGNVSTNVAGIANVLVVNSTGLVITGNLSVTGNATLSGNILGDRIINGNTSVEIQVASGNANINVGGTSNVAVFSTTGMYVTGVTSASGNVTGSNLVTAGLITATGNVQAGNVRTAGLISATGNVNGGNVIGAALVQGVTLSSTGNVQAGNLRTAGLISATGNTTAGNVLTGGLISATGNILLSTSGRIGIGISTPDSELTILANPQTVSYAITGNSTTAGTDLHISGADGANTRITQDAFGTSSYVAFTGRTARGTASVPTQTQSGDILSQFTARGFSNGTLQFGNTSTGLVSIIAAENFTDTSRATNVQILTTAASSITPTTVATFSSASGLSVAGNIAGGNILTTGIISSTGNATAGNVLTAGVVSATANITGGNVLTAGLISATANITGGNVLTAGAMSSTGNITTSGYFVGLFAGSVAGNVATLSASGNVTAGNVLTGGLVSATGNITGNYILGNGALLTGVITSVANINNGTSNVTVVSSGGNVTVGVGGTSNVAVFATTGEYVTGLISASGNVTAGNVLTGGLISATGNITGGNLKTSATLINTAVSTSGNVTGGNILTGGLISATGNITGANIIGVINTNSIINSGSNGTGNIGSASTYFNTVFAQATSATYADLAENYLADANYAPGTVVSIGGSHEVTKSSQDADKLIIGIVSTNPAYQMNTGLSGEYVVAVALVGRVPCQVQGPILRGDMLVSNGNGVARAESNPSIGTVIGKALESFDGTIGVIEVLVGKL